MARIKKGVEKPQLPRAVIEPEQPPKSNKLAKVILTTVQWLLIATVLFCIWKYGFHYRIPERKEMPGYLVILFGLSSAYVWVDVLKWGVTKPFNCLTCMAGWTCLFLALLFHVHYWYLYLPLGAFAGGLYSSIKLRWL